MNGYLRQQLEARTIWAQLLTSSVLDVFTHSSCGILLSYRWQDSSIGTRGSEHSRTSKSLGNGNVLEGVNAVQMGMANWTFHISLRSKSIGLHLTLSLECGQVITEVQFRKGLVSNVKSLLRLGLNQLLVVILVDESVDQQILLLFLLFYLFLITLVNICALDTITVTVFLVAASLENTVIDGVGSRKWLVRFNRFLVNDVLDLIKVFTFEVLIIPILDLTDGSTRQEFHFGNLRPFGSDLIEHFKNELVFLSCPVSSDDRWIENIMPSLSALTTKSTRKIPSNNNPVLCAKLFDL